MKVSSLLRRILLLAVIVVQGLPALADETWIGSLSGNWTVGGNWSGNTPPGTGDVAIFNNLSLHNLSGTLGQAYTIQGILVSNVPGPVSISDPSSSLLTLAPSTFTYTTNHIPLGIAMSNAIQNLTITTPVALGNTQAWVVASGQTLDVSGAISGGSTAGIYKDGFGTLTLEGTNSFTGGFTDNGGAVWINNSLSLGAGSGTRNITIANNLVGAGLHLNGTNGSIVLPSNLQFNLSQNLGGIFNEAGSNVIQGNIYIQSGGGLAYILANAGTLVLNGPIGLSVSTRPFQVGGAGNGIIGGNIGGTAGAGFAFTKTDSGTWTLTNHNSYTGVTVIQGGTLVLSTNVTVPNTPSITLSNATLDASQVFDTPHGVNGFYLSPSSTSQALAGNGSVLGNVAANSTAYLVPGATNGIGTLSFSNSLSLGNMTCAFELNTATTPGNGVNDLINVGGDIDPNGSSLFVTALTPLTSPGTYRLFNYQGAELNSFTSVSPQTDTRYSITLDDSTTNQVNLLVSGSAANLVWSGGNGAAWDLIFAAGPNWDADSDYFYNADSVTFNDTSANNAVNITGTVRPATVTVNNSAVNYAFSGSGKITGGTGITKSGTGILAFTDGNNDFTGPVTVTGGTLAVSTFNPNGSASPLGAGTNITLNGGIFQFGGARPAASAVNRYWTLGANGGTILSTNGVFFLANQVSGAGSLTKTGSVQIILGDINTGVLSTGASNTYSGNTYITQGELQLRNNHALGYGKAVISSGADLSFGGGVNYGTMTNNIDLNGGDGNGGAGTLQVNDANTVVNYGGTINLLANSSVGSFSTTGSFTISGQIIGAGLLTKQNHVTCTVILTCPTNTYSGGTLVNGGTLQLGSGSTCGSLGLGAVTNNGTLAFNHSDSVTINNAISGTGNLTHAGSGTLTLGGANTYSGSTSVNGGTVVVNGSLAGGVTVANNATLGGYGTIGGAVTVNSGGTLALGNSIGTLTVNNVLNLAGTNTMKVTHSANDLIQGITTLSIGGTLNVTVVGSVQAGDTFKLYNAATYAGTFSATNLPSLGGGLAWDASGLTNGTLKVLSTQIPQPRFSSLPFRLGNGNYQLSFTGQNGAGYHVWATTNPALTPVSATWSNLSSGTFSGVPVSYTDTQATNYSKRFYTVTSP
ncbi:MAG TPA: autotransporter-associated beta strand repeat-containing protein [Candidatus Acidoferrum sp.]|nr:autotransporter-associated beta strand repeat-containing protein [Candidatus Acidoferrum sp.]